MNIAFGITIGDLHIAIIIVVELLRVRVTPETDCKQHSRPRQRSHHLPHRSLTTLMMMMPRASPCPRTLEGHPTPQEVTLTQHSIIYNDTGLAKEAASITSNHSPLQTASTSLSAREYLEVHGVNANPMPSTIKPR